jgi:hypothetical protein
MKVNIVYSREDSFKRIEMNAMGKTKVEERNDEMAVQIHWVEEKEEITEGIQ